MLLFLKRCLPGRKTVENIKIYVTKEHIEGIYNSCKGTTLLTALHVKKLFSGGVDTALKLFNAIGEASPFPMVHENSSGEQKKYHPLDLKKKAKC